MAALLARRGIPEDAAETILSRFTEVGLIDDTAFAHAWVESRQQRKSLSRRALRAELQRKGIERETIAEALAEVDEDDELQAAMEFAEVRARRLAGLEPQVQWRRLTGALARKGFSSSVTMAAARAALDGLVEEDLDGSL